jgi:hypothetical protein
MKRQSFICPKISRVCHWVRHWFKKPMARGQRPNPEEAREGALTRQKACGAAAPLESPGKTRDVDP